MSKNQINMESSDCLDDNSDVLLPKNICLQEIYRIQFVKRVGLLESEEIRSSLNAFGKRHKNGQSKEFTTFIYDTLTKYKNRLLRKSLKWCVMYISAFFGIGPRICHQIVNMIDSGISSQHIEGTIRKGKCYSKHNKSAKITNKINDHVAWFSNYAEMKREHIILEQSEICNSDNKISDNIEEEDEVAPISPHLLPGNCESFNFEETIDIRASVNVIEEEVAPLSPHLLMCERHDRQYLANNEFESMYTQYGQTDNKVDGDNIEISTHHDIPVLVNTLLRVCKGQWINDEVS